MPSRTRTRCHHAHARDAVTHMHDAAVRHEQAQAEAAKAREQAGAMDGMVRELTTSLAVAHAQLQVQPALRSKAESCTLKAECSTLNAESSLKN